MYNNYQPNFFYTWNENVNYRPNFNPYNPMFRHPHHENIFQYSQDNSSQNEITIILNNRKLDEEFVSHFINVNEKSRSHQLKIKKIAEVKNALQMIKFLNDKLVILSEELKDENLSDEEWMKKQNTCEEIKGKVQLLLAELNEEEFLKNCKKNLEKRKKKRLREKRIKENWKAKKIEMKEKRKRLHVEANNWIKSKQNIIDKEKQEENLRKEADLVLFNVRAKKNDAKKYLTLLKELENLRRVKVTVAKARGEYVSSAADDVFNNIIEKLTQQWISLDREYSLEEQGLKLLIKTDNEQKFDNKKNPYDSWEITLFGKKISPNYFLHGDINNFITMRCAWDKYLNANDGAPIPIGWIMPNTPSSGAWQKCLNKK